MAIVDRFGYISNLVFWRFENQGSPEFSPKNVFVGRIVVVRTFFDDDRFEREWPRYLSLFVCILSLADVVQLPTSGSTMQGPYYKLWLFLRPSVILHNWSNYWPRVVVRGPVVGEIKKKPIVDYSWIIERYSWFLWQISRWYGTDVVLIWCWCVLISVRICL